MSVFTQFIGSAVPFGQQLTLIDYRNNPTITGIEYLRYGVLKSSAGYSSLLSDWPNLGLNTNTGSTYNQGIGNLAANHILTDGTRYYNFTQTTNTFSRYGTNLTSAWNTAITGAPISQSYDAFRFGSAGTVLISAGNSNTTSAYISGTTATAFTTTSISVAGAANTAGTLGVLPVSGGASAGNIYTSTNGTTWTSRTPSGGGLGAIYAATWSPIGNSFIYIDVSGNIGTTTDGFTITSRGSIGITIQSPSTAQRIQTATNASSTTSTLVTVFTAATSYICRTTDGINFTLTSAITLFGSGFTNITSVQYFNSAYYAVVANALFKSTDDGLTWIRIPSITQTPYATNFSLNSVLSLNGNLIASWTYNNQAVPLYGVVSAIDTAAYVGAIPPSSGTYSNTYVRIK